jgi:hypothetical protein
MSCDETRQALWTGSTESFAALTHLASCEGCRALADAILTEEERMYARIDEWNARPAPDAVRPDRTHRWAVPVLVALAAAAALWLAINGRPPAPPPGEQPSSFGVPPPVPKEPAANELSVSVGTGVVLTLPRAALDVMVADPDRVAAEWLVEGRRKLHLRGVAEGRTSVTLRFAEVERPLVYQIGVGPPRTETDDDTVRLKLGAERRLPLREEPTALATSGPDLLALEEREGEVVLRGLAAGVTDAIVQYSSGPPDMYVVQIEP